MEPAPGKPRIDALALCVARGQSLRSAAKTLGIGSTTARRWSQEPGFADRVDELRRGIISRATGRLARLATKAADTLGELLDPKHEPETRLKAARAILGDLMAIQEHAKLFARLEALEEGQK
jgi:hypothetical protein